ncbi:MAG: hypothetical protein CMK65_01185 [Pseudoalteromonas sp.]|uniref:sugar transferase n=1 Tax=Pseudoalteromonas sp. TaxID=53249 RepID=UPI000C8FFDCC|nr:sugar transferase [Pseudoalteromonas sp.]MAD02228.1 hypothetical protein [Pseudoalteromonas sp.]|tara:strand:+ start:88660 stop:89262 length:603 start_codon:yes stop_codon:yes gene_type:complete
MKLKRLFDIFGSFIGIIVLAPIMLLISFCILITSGLPIIFKQKRVGRYGKDFVIFKFRSMVNVPNSINGSFDAGNSSRVTKIGKVLRYYKLDELPQLFNVLIGDMSIIGPRPEVRRWVEAYPEKWRKVHNVRPGISDPASAGKYRNEESILAKSQNPEQTYYEEILPEKLEIYISYSRNINFLSDLRIIFTTIKAIFTKK